MKFALLALLVAGALRSVPSGHDPSCAAQANQPPRAYSVAAAYDQERRRLVVFGGYRAGSYFGETWEWGGHRWERHQGSGPSPRNGPVAAYDASRRRILLFGGDTRTEGELGDTWEYGSRGWRHLTDAGPGPRTNPSMAYDSRRQRIVLFGGFADNRGLGDTWEWDGSRWIQVAETGPSPRGLAGIAYDARRDRTVLFGGLREAVPGAQSLGDTWEWNGARWTRIDVAGPGPRDHLAMTFDPARGAVILHGGGELGSEENSETWSYDGRGWARISDSGPPRMFARMVFDTRVSAPLLYGGFMRGGPVNEIWHFAGVWQRSFPREATDGHCRGAETGR